MKTMKIEINAEQPLEEVVKELERLGYSKAYFAEEKQSCICTYDTYFNCYSTGVQQFLGQLTTLKELKEMV